MPIPRHRAMSSGVICTMDTDDAEHTYLCIGMEASNRSCLSCPLADVKPEKFRDNDIPF